MRFAIIENGERAAARVGDAELWVRATDADGRPVHASTELEDLLPVAMLVAAEAGEALELDAPLRRSTLVRLNAEFGPFAQRLYDLPVCPELKGDVSAEPELAPVPAAGVGLMFSGGVDSSFSLSWLGQQGITPTHFINIHAGAHDDNPVTWAKRLERIRAIADARGAQMLVIDSNLHRIWPQQHVRAHTIRNVAAVLPFRSLLGAVYYSSSYPYEELSFDRAKSQGISFAEPAVLRTLAPAGFDLAMIGLGTNRIDKTLAIAGDPLVARYLDICMDQDYQAGRAEADAINCGRCLKCVRTLATLDARGLLHGFAHAFDIERWARERASWIAWLIENGNDSAKADLRRLGYDVPETDPSAVWAPTAGPASEPAAPEPAHVPEPVQLEPAIVQPPEAAQLAALRAELAATRASASFRFGNAIARALRVLRGRPLD
jgi:hypothetical protein